MNNKSKAKEIQRNIARIRASIWHKKTDEEKQNGIGWSCLDYVAMNRIEELEEELEKLS